MGSPHTVHPDLVAEAAVAVPGHLHLAPTVLVATLLLEEGRDGDARHLADEPNQHAHLHASTPLLRVQGLERHRSTLL